ncbi:MAG: hypothetical protein B7Y39_11810 [Bdellovibrio sp. 28-41-41]|nr:MAG: hypothetical protein B7Y39_11810 [Bdellovibrio sp. 28-41-41]
MIILLSSLFSSYGWTQTFDVADFFRRQEALVRKQSEQINCVYTDLLLKNKLISEEQKGKYYFQPSAKTCSQVDVKSLNFEIENLEHQKKNLIPSLNDHPPLWGSFPLFSSFLKSTPMQEKASLAQSNLTDFAYPPEKRFDPKVIFKKPLNVELGLRKFLDIKDPRYSSPINSLSECSLNEKAISKWHRDLHLSVDEYSTTYWQTLLHILGYDCTVTWYQWRSQKLNQAQNSVSRAQSESSQKIYAKNLKEIQSVPLRAQKAWLQGETFILIPQLGYDIPDKPWAVERERLQYSEMRLALQKLGARLIVIPRSTIAHRTAQIRETTVALKKFIEADKKHYEINNRTQTYYFLSRSMGAMVLREVLEQTPSLHPYVKAALSVGGTPYGSVIAEFKSRADIFDEVFYKTSNLIKDFVSDPLGSVYLGAKLGLDPQTKAFSQAVKYRQNYKSMSHFEFQPHRQNHLPFPVVNLIFLPLSLKNYYNGSARIAEVDFTFMHMMMYGPTEGSSPLSHAAWDTTRSQRIFDHEFNHLAFWQWDESTALRRWLAILKTTKEIYQIP